MKPLVSFISRSNEGAAVAFLVLLVIVFSLANPNFLTVSTLLDVMRASIVPGIFAMGVLLVLASGGIDVSFPAVAAFSMYVTTKLMGAGQPLEALAGSFWAAVIVSMFIGLMLGLANGVLVDRLKVSSLIVTIGTLNVYRGLMLAFIGASVISRIPSGLEAFSRRNILTVTTSLGMRVSLPTTFLILVVVALVTWLLLNRTLLGRLIYAMGGSLDAAERLGANLRRLRLWVYGYAGCLAGLAGIVHTTQQRLANPLDHAGSELDIIAAVVLGGARVTGGSGSVFGALVGVLVVVLLRTNLVLLGISSDWQRLFIGMVVLVATWLSYRGAERRMEARPAV